jgi:MerR family transcriptional regulator, light-induced transcriptional regulator
MTNRRDPKLSIAAVERDVGISKDVLRVWERRYGFPAPERDSNGERLYPPDQVARLQLVKRLIDQGHRPGRLLRMPLGELRTLSATRAGDEPSEAREADEDVEALVNLIGRHKAVDYANALQQRLVRQGLQRFVQDTVAPLTQLVGAAWEKGRLQVFEEHLFTELTNRVLRQAIAAVPVGQRPRVLLTTLPNEQHTMGLLMVEALLSLEGAHCISLGTQTPLLEIARSAVAHRADVVGLSFSTAFPARQIPELLRELRAGLPASSELWAGGGGTRRLLPQDGVLILGVLDDLSASLERWRSARR